MGQTSIFRRWQADPATHKRPAWIRFRKDASAFAAIEFAFIAPVMLLFYFGLIDLTNWLATYRKLILTGSTAADLVTQAPGELTPDDLQGFYTGIEWIIHPFPTNKIDMTLRNYRVENNNVTLQWQDSFNNACSVEASDAAKLQMAVDEMSEGNDVLVADVCTSVSPIVLQMFGFQPFDMSYQIHMRPRQGKFIDCDDC